MKIAPCKDCPKKGCGPYHDECPEYQEFKKERQILSDKMREMKKCDEITIERAKRHKEYFTRQMQRR